MDDLISHNDALARMNAARDSSAGVTCPASRHAAMIAEALIDGSGYPMLTDDPKHCGETIAAVVAALWEARALPSVGVKVKPLEWFEVEKSRFGGKYTADGYTFRYIEGLWLLDFAGETKNEWRFPTLDAAKAAAQADYEARILAALDVQPAPAPSPDVVALQAIADYNSVPAMVFEEKHPELRDILDKTDPKRWAAALSDFALASLARKGGA